MATPSEFFTRQSERFGPSGVLPHHEARAARLQRICGSPPKRILELGCGAGGAAVSSSNLGFEVTAVELSPLRAQFATDLATETSAKIIEGDFYVDSLGSGFDVVTYWNGFGVGDDADQRKLLQRVAAEWLVPEGRMLVDVFNPTWWARLSADIKRHDEYNAWQQTTFEGKSSRFVDSWWSKEDRSDEISQSVRCYSVPDLELLICGTALRIEKLEIDDSENLEGFNSSYAYLAVLIRE